MRKIMHQPPVLVTWAPGPSSFPASQTLSAHFFSGPCKGGRGPLGSYMVPGVPDTQASGDPYMPHSLPPKLRTRPILISRGLSASCAQWSGAGLKPGRGGWGVTRSSAKLWNLHFTVPRLPGPAAFGMQAGPAAGRGAKLLCDVES